LALCKRKKATLIIAKLDRLSRNLHFTTGLLESKVNFVACDMPFANKLEIHVRSMFAEHERNMISKRASERLQTLKAQPAFQIVWNNKSREPPLGIPKAVRRGLTQINVC
jgi:DNA invertase Pin-like site-specific DNA recombinase